MKVYIVGEDAVTCAIIKRVLFHCSKDFEILSELPARGGQIKSKISDFNKLASSNPVILLMDLDAIVCAPQLIRDSLSNVKHSKFIFNIAVDEGEAWLMADRNGFADFIGVDIEYIPHSKLKKQGGPRALIEMDFNYKSSRFLTHELILKSKKLELIKQLSPKEGATKGPEYNSCILPFINNIWNIDDACKNSDSLTRMVNRIRILISK